MRSHVSRTSLHELRRNLPRGQLTNLVHHSARRPRDVAFSQTRPLQLQLQPMMYASCASSQDTMRSIVTCSRKAGRSVPAAIGRRQRNFSVRIVRAVDILLRTVRTPWTCSEQTSRSAKMGSEGFIRPMAFRYSTLSSGSCTSLRFVRPSCLPDYFRSIACILVYHSFSALSQVLSPSGGHN